MYGEERLTVDKTENFEICFLKDETWYLYPILKQLAYTKLDL